MAGIAGSHPSNLAQPVPGMDLGTSVTPQLMSKPAELPPVPMDNPEAQVAREEMNRPSLDDIFGPSSSSQPSLDDIFADKPAAAEPSFTEKLDQFGADLKTNFVGSFGNDNQKEMLLKQTYGNENVRRDGDDFYLTRNGKEEKFTRSMLDTVVDIAKVTSGGPRAAFDAAPGLVKDVASMGKMVMTEAIALPGEVAAAVTLNPVAMFAARLVGGAAGEVAADTVGEKLGLPKDPNAKPGELIARSALVGGLRATLGWGFDKAATWVGNKLSGKAVEIAERQAAQAATPEMAVSNMMRDIGDTEKVLSRMKSEGIIDGKFLFRPDQATHEPNLHAAALQASKSKLFQDVAEQQGEMMSKAWQKLDQGASKLSGGEGLGNKFLEKLSSADKAFGALIGDARQTVIKNSPNAEIEAPLVKEQVSSIMNYLGFAKQTKMQVPDNALGSLGGAAPAAVAVGEEFVAPSASKVADMLELSSSSRIADAQKIIGDVSKLADMLTNGKDKLSAKALNIKYTELTDRISKRMGDNTSMGYTKLMIKLKDAIRDDFAEGIEKVGGAELGDAYATSMKRYRMFRQAEESLGKLLDRDSVSSEQFVKHVFTGGIEGYERIAQTKKLLNVTDPGLFQQLKGQWFKQIMDASPLKDAKSDRLGGVNWTSFEKKLNSIGEDNLKQVFEPKELANLRDFLTIGKKLQNADFAYLPQDKAPGMMLRALNAAKSFVGLSHFLGHHRSGPSRISSDAANLVLNIAPDDMALKYLTSGGVEDIMKLVPTARKAEVRTNLERIVEYGLKAAEAPMSKVPGMQTAPLAGEASREAGDMLNSVYNQPGASQQRPAH